VRKKRENFSKALPESFARADAIVIGQALNIGSRRVDRWLRSLIDEGVLASVKYGYYQKVNPNELVSESLGQTVRQFDSSSE
jgi:hypothetical protein